MQDPWPLVFSFLHAVQFLEQVPWHIFSRYHGEGAATGARFKLAMKGSTAVIERSAIADEYSWPILRDSTTLVEAHANLRIVLQNLPAPVQSAKDKFRPELCPDAIETVRVEFKVTIYIIVSLSRPPTPPTSYNLPAYSPFENNFFSRGWTLLSATAPESSHQSQRIPSRGRDGQKPSFWPDGKFKRIVSLKRRRDSPLVDPDGVNGTSHSVILNVKDEGVFIQQATSEGNDISPS
ncbi:uncharacterized protein EV420DRAFT_1484891 [Desarmillaria tabescens]|uniref:Uncharacterized protein n=1 Tax=Armillaria tabescens TaxID=1929756 RepID=A0AA39MQT7_ARMTA|nr:uncharacterized protein EV420DRAFT_1484891 [Desarmillaria tabescens]KAK0443671.1 hypothetical protein EV420DRAFT_1484891 [Desarmillaria tabescens]